MNESLAIPCEVLLDEAARTKLRKVGVDCSPTCPIPNADPAAWEKTKEDPVGGTEVRYLLKRLHPSLTLSEGGAHLLQAFCKAWMKAAVELLVLSKEKSGMFASIVPPAHLKRCIDAAELGCLVHGPRLVLPPICSLRIQLLDVSKPVGIPYSFTLPRKEKLAPAFAHACQQFGYTDEELALVYHGIKISLDASPDALGIIKTATLYAISANWWETEGYKGHGGAARMAAAALGKAVLGSPTKTQERDSPAALEPAAVKGSNKGAGGGGGGGGQQLGLGGRQQQGTTTLPPDALQMAVQKAGTGEFTLVATGFGGDTSPEGIKGRHAHVTGTGGGLGTSPERWGRSPRLERASQKGKTVQPKDAAMLLGSVLKSMNVIEDAMASLATLAHALPEAAGGGSGGAIFDLKAIRTTALQITEAGKELNSAITTVEVNLARGALQADTRKFAERTLGKSPIERARNMSPFVSKIAKGLSPRR